MKEANRNKRWKMRQKPLFAALIALLLMLGPSVLAQGFSSYNKKIPDKGENFGCSTCHAGSDLNEFGVEFKENNREYNDALAAKDSDGDGFTNMEELSAQPPTNPGNNCSYPGGNQSTNETTNNTEMAAYLGPIEMKSFVELFYAVLIPLVIGTMACLVVAEGLKVFKQRLNVRRPRNTEQGQEWKTEKDTFKDSR